MAEEEFAEAKYWIENGAALPMQVARGFGCCAIGPEDVGLRIAYQESHLDQRVKQLRVKLSPEHALELAAKLQLFADRPRPPLEGSRKTG